MDKRRFSVRGGLRVAVAASCCILACLGGSAGAQSEQPDRIHVGLFSTAAPGGELPPEWQPLFFRKIETHTRYTLVQKDGRVVVKAESASSASGLIRKIRIDPYRYPLVTWRWNVGNILQKGDVTRKEGDDYPARIYITFEYDASKLSFLERAKYNAVRLLYGEYPPTAALNYIWGSHAPKGLVVPNPFTERAMMIVVESGKDRLNQWVEEKRNVLEDYRSAFNSDPPVISGVAVMTDTDNTGESATSYFGDIVFETE